MLVWMMLVKCRHGMYLMPLGFIHTSCDPEYIVTVPLFDKVTFYLKDKPFTIVKQGHGSKIRQITYDNEVVDGYFVSHGQLQKGKKLVITVD